MRTKSLAVAVLWLTFLAVGAISQAIAAVAKVESIGKEEVPPSPFSGDRSLCNLQKTDGQAISYWNAYPRGVRTVTYFDPAACGGTVYPFRINSLSFPLYNPGGYQWPVSLDVVVYTLLEKGNPCAGPGKELCRLSVTCTQAAFQYPAVGTVSFPNSCCANGPFYIGVEYTDPGAGPFPSVLFDSLDVTACDNWQRYTDTLWYEWSNFWSPPVPGYPHFYVSGETNASDCSPDIKIDEVKSYTAVDPTGNRNDAFVELYNSGGSAAGINGWQLAGRTGSAIAALPNWSIPAGALLRVTFGTGADESDFSDGIAHFFTQGDSVDVIAISMDEVGLYRGAISAANLIDFVAWSRSGSYTPGVPHGDAVSQGLWTSGDFVNMSSYGIFSNLGLCPSGYDHDVSSDWHEYDFGLFIGAQLDGQNSIQRYPYSGLSIAPDTIFEWAAITGATDYLLEIDNDPTFATPAIAAFVTGTSYVVTGLAEDNYYWRVRVRDAGGVIGEHHVWEFYYDPFLKVVKDRANPLGVPQVIQHKDSRLLCITDDFDAANQVNPPCERPGCLEATADADDANQPWDGAHNVTADHVRNCLHCQNYCGRASIQMVNFYYSTDDNLTQDHISYELNQANVHPGNPEGDLGHGRYAWVRPNEMGPVISWALGGHGANDFVQALPWATVQNEINNNHPIIVLRPNPGHWMVVDGHRVRGGQNQIHLVDPWPAANGGGAQTGWHNYGGAADIAFIAYYTLAAGNPAAPRAEFSTVLTDDTDGDGIRDFDEGLPGYPATRPRRFQAKFNEVDSDSDEVNDKPEIRNYTFHDQAAYHPTHPGGAAANDPLGFPDIDNDGLRAEHDCDTDNDSDFDGGEDIDGDGKNPVPAPGNMCLTETCQFLADQLCITLHTNKDVYYLGEPVYLVDYHFSRPTHTFHSNSSYNYELGPDCVIKVDSNSIAWSSSFKTNAGGHAISKKVMTCLFPGEYYMYADVLADHHYSSPDNWDPWDCWECIFDWFHGWHWGYDYTYHNPTSTWPTYSYPKVCTETPSPSITTVTIECPWWWWCYQWPPVLDSYWIGVGIPTELVSMTLVSNPVFSIVHDDTCGPPQVINQFQPDPLVQQSLMLNFNDYPNTVWLGFSIQNWQIPDSLMSTSVQLVIQTEHGKSALEALAQSVVHIKAGDMVYGWSSTSYDSIPIGDFGPPFVCGDANGNTLVNIADVVYLIQYIFAGGPPPVPLESGDVNCNLVVNIADAVYLIQFIFSGGPAPCAACP